MPVKRVLLGALFIAGLFATGIPQAHASTLRGDTWAIVQGFAMTLTVHTVGGAECTAQDSPDQDKGYTSRFFVPPAASLDNLTGPPGSVKTDYRGVAVFTFRYPASMKPARRYALASCASSSGDDVGGFLTSFIAPGRIPGGKQLALTLKVDLQPGLAAINSIQRLVVSTAPGALCTLTRQEPAGGDLEYDTYLGPTIADKHGGASWKWKATSFGTATIACDANHSFGSEQVKYLIRS